MNGWRESVSYRDGYIVKADTADDRWFYRHFDDVELLVFQEIVQRCLDALSDRRVETGDWRNTLRDPGRQSLHLQDMGMLAGSCVLPSYHPLALMDGPFSDDTLRNWPSLVREDTSRTLPKRIPGCWITKKRLIVPDWESSAACSHLEDYA